MLRGLGVSEPPLCHGTYFSRRSDTFPFFSSLHGHVDPWSGSLSNLCDLGCSRAFPLSVACCIHILISRLISVSVPLPLVRRRAFRRQNTVHVRWVVPGDCGWQEGPALPRCPPGSGEHVLCLLAEVLHVAGAQAPGQKHSPVGSSPVPVPAASLLCGVGLWPRPGKEWGVFVLRSHGILTPRSLPLRLSCGPFAPRRASPEGQGGCPCRPSLRPPLSQVLAPPGADGSPC